MKPAHLTKLSVIVCLGLSANSYAQSQCKTSGFPKYSGVIVQTQPCNPQPPPHLLNQNVPATNRGNASTSSSKEGSASDKRTTGSGAKLCATVSTFARGNAIVSYAIHPTSMEDACFMAGSSVSTGAIPYLGNGRWDKSQVVTMEPVLCKNGGWFALAGGDDGSPRSEVQGFACGAANRERAKEAATAECAKRGPGCKVWWSALNEGKNENVFDGCKVTTVTRNHRAGDGTGSVVHMATWGTQIEEYDGGGRGGLVQRCKR